MHTTPNARLLEWVRKFRADLTPEGTITRVELYHSIEGEMASGCHVREGGRDDERTRDDFQEIWNEGRRKRQRPREVYSAMLSGLREKPKPDEQKAFTNQGSHHGDHGTGASATARGEIMAEMRRTNDLHALVVRMCEATAGSAAVQLQREREENNRLREQTFEYEKLRQAMLDRQLERDIARDDAKAAAAQTQMLWGTLVQLAPVIMTRLLAQPAPAGAALPLQPGLPLPSLSLPRRAVEHPPYRPPRAPHAAVRVARLGDPGRAVAHLYSPRSRPQRSSPSTRASASTQQRPSQSARRPRSHPRMENVMSRTSSAVRQLSRVERAQAHAAASAVAQMARKLKGRKLTKKEAKDLTVVASRVALRAAAAAVSSESAARVVRQERRAAIEGAIATVRSRHDVRSDPRSATSPPGSASEAGTVSARRALALGRSPTVRCDSKSSRRAFALAVARARRSSVEAARQLARRVAGVAPPRSVRTGRTIAGS